jgi:hypothetical protein
MLRLLNNLHHVRLPNSIQYVCVQRLERGRGKVLSMECANVHIVGVADPKHFSRIPNVPIQFQYELYMYSVMGTVLISVADPDPYVLGLSDADPLVRGTNPDPSIIKQN